MTFFTFQLKRNQMLSLPLNNYNPFLNIINSVLFQHRQVKLGVIICLTWLGFFFCKGRGRGCRVRVHITFATPRCDINK